MFALLSGEGSFAQDFRAIVGRLCMCLLDTQLRSLACDTLLVFHQKQYIDQWGPPDDKMKTFWEISSLVSVAVATQIIDMEVVRLWINCGKL